MINQTGRKPYILLIEYTLLLLLIAIIGYGIYQFYIFDAVARQMNIRSTLITINKLEARYKANSGEYSTNMEMIGWRSNAFDSSYSFYFGDTVYNKGSTWRNALPDYFKLSLDDNYYLYAVGDLDGDSALDIWVIDSKGKLTHLSDDRKM